MFKISHFIEFKRTLFLSLTALLFSICTAGVYAAQHLDFTYDALGRLTFVSDSVNGNRDYDYDKAGNRTQVNANTNSDGEGPSGPSAPVPTVPDEPTNLSRSGPFSPYGGYSATWNTVDNADYYLINTSSHQITSTGSIAGTSNQNIITWVKACNNVGCSSKAYF